MPHGKRWLVGGTIFTRCRDAMSTVQNASRLVGAVPDVDVVVAVDGR